MRRRSHSRGCLHGSLAFGWFPALWGLVLVLGCANDEPSSNGKGGSAGSSGAGGAAGDAGAAGSAATGGMGGDAGAGGGAGASGAAGSGHAGAAGQGPQGCHTCHGSPTNPAPPFDLDGNDDTSLPGVGAHQVHLQGGPWHKPHSCSECHVVPTVATWDPSLPSHMNGINDLEWGPVAQSGTYDATEQTCSNIYCHGSTLGRDAVGSTANRTPKWTVVDGSQASCGTSCHTLPPGGKHVPAANCAPCHASVIASMTPGIPPEVTWANAELHINGNVEIDGPGCTTCHGDPATGTVSPPKGTGGETETNQPAVGAHQIHLAASAWRRMGQCTDCHVMPPGSSHPNGVVEFGWDGPSAVDGASPAYVSSTNTCSSVYCHGTTLAGPVAGGTVNRTPEWTVVDGTYNVCGTTCHTLPPGGSHPPSSSCQTCHGSTITAIDPANPSAATWNDPSLHVNGTVDF